MKTIKPKKRRSTTRRPSSAKPYWEMNLEELREATKEFDKPFVFERSKPLTPAMRAAWERAKSKRARSKNARGARMISLSVEQHLLERADALAQKQGISRAQLVARGLEAVLSGRA